MQEFQNLVKSPAWDRLVKYANAQVETRRRSVNGPIKTEEDRAEANFTLGEAAGIELFIKMPGILVETAQAIVDKATEEQENGDSTQTT